MVQTTRQWNGVTETEIVSNSVADGAQVFGLNSTGPINVVEYLTFSPAATVGSVIVQTSPDGGATWDDMASGGLVQAATSSASNRTKPSGRGRATHIRFTLSGVATATSFKALVTQGIA